MSAGPDDNRGWSMSRATAEAYARATARATAAIPRKRGFEETVEASRPTIRPARIVPKMTPAVRYRANWGVGVKAAYTKVTHDARPPKKRRSSSTKARSLAGPATIVLPANRPKR